MLRVAGNVQFSNVDGILRDRGESEETVFEVSRSGCASEAVKYSDGFVVPRMR